MAWRRSVVYAAVDAKGSVQFHYTPRPSVDAAWHRRRGKAYLIPFHPPLPPPWAAEACRFLQRQVSERRTEAVRGFGNGSVSDASNRWWRRFFPPGRSSRMNGPGGVGGSLRRMAMRAGRLLAMDGCRWPVRVGDAIALNPSFASSDGAVLSAGLRQETRTVDVAWPSEEDLDVVFGLVEGRLLAELEVLQILERRGVETDSPVEDCLTALTLEGRTGRRPGLERTVFGGWRCLRCGETDDISVSDCAACGEPFCAECDACRGLGVVRSCTLLYSGVSEGPSEAVTTAEGEAGATISYVSHPLTKAQGRAANLLERFVLGETGGEALVWAVCGAGKTELCFPAVARILRAGGRVLFAIPRRDIVRELGVRLRNAFPKTAVQVLHGGDGRIELERLGPGTLTVATTHQVLRFESAFDLVIVDEVDAFPYRTSPMLQRAVLRAKAPGGRIVYMSATPTRSLLNRARDGKVHLITVPARHHGHPLPVPRLHRDATLGWNVGGADAPDTPLDTSLDTPLDIPLDTSRDTEAHHDARSDAASDSGLGVLSVLEPDFIDGPDRAFPSEVGRTFHKVLATATGQRPPRILLRLIDDSLQSEPPARVIVFAPDVAKTEALGRRLAEAYRGSRTVLWSHSRDPDRDKKLDALRHGRCDVFVATTILERGVTVPDVDVIVMYADEERVFSEATLVQMAGRVGRSTERPKGRVHFVGRRISPEMRRAVQQIEGMNAEASALGLLVQSDPRHEPRQLGKGSRARVASKP